MNKSWIFIIVIAIVSMLAIIGFEFYMSVSGGNSEFVKQIQDEPINPDLGVNKLDFISSLEDNILVVDESLDQVLPTVTVTPSGIVVPTGSAAPTLPPDV